MEDAVACCLLMRSATRAGIIRLTLDGENEGVLGGIDAECDKEVENATK